MAKEATPWPSESHSFPWAKHRGGMLFSRGTASLPHVLLLACRLLFPIRLQKNTCAQHFQRGHGPGATTQTLLQLQPSLCSWCPGQLHAATHLRSLLWLHLPQQVLASPGHPTNHQIRDAGAA